MGVKLSSTDKAFNILQEQNDLNFDYTVFLTQELKLPKKMVFPTTTEFGGQLELNTLSSKLNHQKSNFLERQDSWAMTNSIRSATSTTESSGSSMSTGNNKNFRVLRQRHVWSSGVKERSRSTTMGSQNYKNEEAYLRLYHSGQIDKSFLPMRVVLIALGRFPFVSLPTRNRKEEKRAHPEGILYGDEGMSVTKETISTTYHGRLLTPYWAYFFVTSAFLMFLLVTNSLGFMDMFLKWKFFPGEWSDHEQGIFKRNIVPFVLYWSCLLHTTVGNVSYFIHRHSIAEFLNFWNVAADMLDLPPSNSPRRFLISSNLWYFGFFVLLLISYVFR